MSFRRDSSDMVYGGCLAIVAGLVIMGVVLALLVPGCLTGTAYEAARVAREEFGPRALLEKYEWFKNVSAKLDEKMANIKQYSHRSENLRKQYGDTPYKDWDRKDKETLAIWDSEVAGIKASFNELASQYNAAMAKENWRFAEVGRLPSGAATPLPREYKAYLEE